MLWFLLALILLFLTFFKYFSIWQVLLRVITPICGHYRYWGLIPKPGMYLVNSCVGMALKYLQKTHLEWPTTLYILSFNTVLNQDSEIRQPKLAIVTIFFGILIFKGGHNTCSQSLKSGILSSYNVIGIKLRWKQESIYLKLTYIKFLTKNWVSWGYEFGCPNDTAV